MEERREPAERSAPAEESPQQYLTFELGTESYGLEILKIQEIIGITEITPVPKTPKCLKGVINLRGRIIPILGLRTLFEMDGEGHGARSSIIVTQSEMEEQVVTMGLLVDEASEVVKIARSDIEKPPLLSGSRTFDFIQGIARTDGKIIFLLELERLLSEVEQTAVRSVLISHADSEELSVESSMASGTEKGPTEEEPARVRNP